jgi:prevent-host-death family protein
MASQAKVRETRPASLVKTNWRDIVADANIHGEVVVTNHERPEVVVVSMARYEKLRRDAEANDPLAKLRAEWDRELAWLKEPGAEEEIRRIFNSTPEEIARAANAAAKRKR